MKTNFLKLAAILIAVVALSISGCKKDDNTDDNPNTNSLQQLSKNGVSFDNATGDVLKDANNVLSAGSAKTLYDLPCNVTIDSSSIVGDTITYSITYNGLNCDGTLLRVGNVEVKRNVNENWSQAGVNVIVDYINLKITRVSDMAFVILDGTVDYQNVTGGYLTQLGTIYTIITYRAEGIIYAAFSDNTTQTWNFARQISYSGASGSYVITCDGFGAADGYTNLECWGLNAEGENFYSQITQSIVVKEACGWDPCSGIIIYDIPSGDKSATVSFGYDDNNDEITNGDCPTRFRLDWDVSGNAGTLYLQLH